MFCFSVNFFVMFCLLLSSVAPEQRTAQTVHTFCRHYIYLYLWCVKLGFHVSCKCIQGFICFYNVSPVPYIGCHLDLQIEPKIFSWLIRRSIKLKSNVHLFWQWINSFSHFSKQRLLLWFLHTWNSRIKKSWVSRTLTNMNEQYNISCLVRLSVRSVVVRNAHLVTSNWLT